jgi:hypothetical protein
MVVHCNELVFAEACICMQTSVPSSSWKRSALCFCNIVTDTHKPPSMATPINFILAGCGTNTKIRRSGENDQMVDFRSAWDSNRRHLYCRYKRITHKHKYTNTLPLHSTTHKHKYTMNIYLFLLNTNQQMMSTSSDPFT